MGSTTVKATDVSMLGEPSASYTIDVTAGPVAQFDLFSGSTNLSTLSTANAVTLAAGPSGEFTLDATDASGDQVPADATYTVTLCRRLSMGCR